jgi:hypothetical protein
VGAALLGKNVGVGVWCVRGGRGVVVLCWDSALAGAPLGVFSGRGAVLACARKDCVAF